MSETDLADPAARAAEAAAIALLLVDQAGIIQYANSAAEPIFATSRRKLTGRRLEEAGPWGVAAAAMAGRALSSGRELLAHEISVRLADGPATASIDVMPDGAGTCIAIRPAPPGDTMTRGDGAASAAVGFGRMLSHELKNPLAGARGAAQLLTGTDDAETVELARLILVELDRAGRIAEHWSAVGDIAPQPFAGLNLHGLVRDAIASARAAAPANIAFRETFDPSLPDAHGDCDLVSQAVLNLLRNAAEAVTRNEGGLITVTTRYRQPRPGEPAPRARLEIEVLDDGPGVPESLRQNVFNPFVTGKPAGEGLGLAFVSRVAELHGGGVAFESEPGRTAFRLFLHDRHEGQT